MGALRVLTWNLNGLDDRALDERTEAACFAMLLRPAQPDVVLLQEVVARSWYAHLRHHFAAAGYVSVPGDPPRSSSSSYFCAVLVRGHAIRASGVERFPGSAMGRALVWARLDWEGRDLLVGTAHLESLKDGRAERMRQTDEVAARLLAHEGPAVFGGDTNLRVEEAAAIPRLAELADAWVALGEPPALRDTWHGGRARARYDRVWCKGLAPLSMSLLGAPGAPSDHLGLEIVAGDGPVVAEA